MNKYSKKDIKAIFLDMDGTILDGMGQISPELKLSIQKITDRGILVHLASGRSYESMSSFYNQLNLKSALIAYNGAQLIDFEGNVIKKQKLLNPILVKDAEDIAKKKDIFLQFYIDNKPYYIGDEEIAKEYQIKSGNRSFKLEELQDYYNSCTKGMFLVSENDCDNSELIKCYRELSSSKVWNELASIFFSSVGTLEFLNSGTSKGDMISYVLELLDISHENTMAIGDGLNDKQMICNAGVGVAMGNALPELKSMADIIIENNTENGVSKFLNNFFGLI